MSESRKTWECLIDVFLKVKVSMDTLVWKSIVLLSVTFHLSDVIDEVFWFLEKTKLLSVDQVTQFIFDLDDELNDIKTIESVIGEADIW